MRQFEYIPKPEKPPKPKRLKKVKHFCPMPAIKESSWDEGVEGVEDGDLMKCPECDQWWHCVYDYGYGWRKVSWWWTPNMWWRTRKPQTSIKNA